jgi:hypothetical protein
MLSHRPHRHAKFLSCLFGRNIPSAACRSCRATRPASSTGHVYVLTNQPTGNAVMVFHRDASGELTRKGTFASGGNGAGTGTDPRQSQNPVVLSETVAFSSPSMQEAIRSPYFGSPAMCARCDEHRLVRGTMPVQPDRSRRGLVYVVKCGAVPNISGFKVDASIGHLTQLAGSTQPLPGGPTAAPAEVSFVPAGNVLLVTEKKAPTKSTLSSLMTMA